MINKLVVFVFILAVSQARRPRILYGDDAQPGEFPHQVSLHVHVNPPMDDDHLCGGSIINEQWILTAAHCIAVYDIMKYYVENITVVVKAGKHNLSVTEASEQSSVIETYFIHENFKIPGGMPFDIALVKLAKPFKFNERVAPIKLPKKDSEPTGQVVISGWGIIEDPVYIFPNRTNILRKGILDIIDRSDCRKAVIKEYLERGVGVNDDVISEMNICTSSEKLRPSIGDSGGPLISKNGTKEIVGIISWNNVSFSSSGPPAVYLRVSSFIDWIEKIMSNN